MTLHKLPYEHNEYLFYFTCEQATKNNICINVRYGKHDTVFDTWSDQRIIKRTCVMQFELINSKSLGLSHSRCNTIIPKNLDAELLCYLKSRLFKKKRKKKRHNIKTVINSLMCKDKIHCLMILSRKRGTSWVKIGKSTTMFEPMLVINIAEFLT